MTAAPSTSTRDRGTDEQGCPHHIGVGGDPRRLLRRVAELLSPDGRILVELGPPHAGGLADLGRLQDRDGNLSAWFRWARVAADTLELLASAAGLRAVEEGTSPCQPNPVFRWFAALSLA